MSRDHDSWVVESAHQAATIVIDFPARSTSTNQRDIRLQSFDLAFDVVHPAKRKNLMAMKPNQVGKGAAFGVNLFQGQRRFCSRSARKSSKVAQRRNRFVRISCAMVEVGVSP